MGLRETFFPALEFSCGLGLPKALTAGAIPGTSPAGRVAAVDNRILRTHPCFRRPGFQCPEQFFPVFQKFGLNPSSRLILE